MSQSVRTWSYEEFELKECLGEGAFGAVYKAFDTLQRKDFAVKKIKEGEPEQEKEHLKNIKELKHEYIVSFHGFFVHESKIYIIMDYCPFNTLRETIRSRVKQDDETVKSWAVQMMSVLTYMKNRPEKIVHNDIKPENILITDKNSILVVDLGEAQIVQVCNTMSKRSGTGIYIAPERALGAPSSIDSDTWSCGVVIYEVIHFRWPFQTIYEFIQGARIEYESSSAAQFFKPILEGIFVATPGERLSPEEILLRIQSPDKLRDQFKSQDSSLKKEPRTWNPKRIQDHFPKQTLKNYINIVDLQMLDRSLKQEGIVLLAGVPGAGKSTLAIEYAKLFSKTTSDAVVVWINADQASKIEDSFRRILVDDLKTDEEKYARMKDDDKVRAITKHIIGAKTPHLFVFDNIEEEQIGIVEAIAESLPVISNLKMMLTSRNRELNKSAGLKMNIIELGGLLADQVKQYYDERIISGIRLSKAKADTIFNQVLLKRAEISPYYLDKLVGTLELYVEDNGLHEDEIGELVEMLREVDVTDKMLGMLKNRPDCREVFKTLPFLDPDEISVRLLEKISSDKTANRNALAVLEKYSLVSAFRTNDLKYIRLHRLTADSLDKQLRSNMAEYEAAKKTVMRTLSELTGEVRAEKSFSRAREKAATVYVHLVKMSSVLSNDDDLDEANFLDNLVYMDSRRYMRFDQAIALQRRKIEKLKKCYKQDEHSSDIADNMSSLCEIMSSYWRMSFSIRTQNLGLEKQAIEAEKEVRTSYQGREDEPAFAANLFKISRAFHSTERFEKALALINEVESAFKKHFGSGQATRELVDFLKDKAEALRQLNKQKEAVATYFEVEELLRKYYHEFADDKRLALNLLDVADGMSEMKTTDKAFWLYKEVASLFRKFYLANPNDEEHAMLLKPIADSMRALNKPDEAVKLYKEVTALYRRHYDANPDDAMFAFELRSLGNSMKELSEYDEAAEMYKESAFLLRKMNTLKPDDKFLAFKLLGLANDFKSMGKLDDAVEFFRESAGLLGKYCHENPSDEIFTWIIKTIADDLAQLGKSDDAKNLYKQVESILKLCYEKKRTDQNYLTKMNDLADAMREVKDFDEATKLYKETAAINRSFYQKQPNGERLAKILCDLADKLSAINRKNEALGLYKEALSLYKKFTAENPNDSRVVSELESIDNKINQLSS